MSLEAELHKIMSLGRAKQEELNLVNAELADVEKQMTEMRQKAEPFNARYRELQKPHDELYNQVIECRSELQALQMHGMNLVLEYLASAIQE